MIQSNPKVKPQPAGATYGAVELFLFERLTRADYEKKYGEQPPAWDPTQQIKRWFDTSVLEASADPAHELVTYSMYQDAVNLGGSPETQIKKVTMTKLAASLPNLPGIYSYPKYVSAPTTAMLLGPDQKMTPLSSAALLYKEQAQAIADAIKKDTGVIYNVMLSDQYTAWPWIAVWGEEKRRWYDLVRDTEARHSGNPGAVIDAWFLLSKMYNDGVGSPGKWQLSDSMPVWLSTVPYPQSWDSRPEVGIPIRDLFTNEKWHPSPFGLQVDRTDLGTGGAGGTGGGDSTAAIREVLAVCVKTDANVQQILKLISNAG